MCNKTNAFGAKTLKNHKHKLWFTLTELLITISILAILTTIALISFNNISSQARDSARTSDMSNLKKSFELYSVKSDKYPLPTNPSSITYSWGIVWYQWTVWENTIRALWIFSKIPVDPKFNIEYTYSILSNFKEYQIAWIVENNNQSFLKDINSKSLITQAYAADSLPQTNFRAYITWNYNWLVAKVDWLNDCASVLLPSIILSDIPSSSKLENTTSSSFVFSNDTNVPSSFKTKLSQTWSMVFYDYSSTNSGLLVYSNSKVSNTLTGSLELADKIKQLINNTNLKTLNNYKEISTTIDAKSLSLIWANIINKNIWCQKVDTATQNLAYPSFTCNTQPNIPNWTGYTLWNPQTVNQNWTYSDTPWSCTFSCNPWYAFDEIQNKCVLDQCVWDLANLNWTIKIWSTQSFTQSWIYDSIDTDNICRYECNNWYSYSGSTSKCEPNNCNSQTATIAWHTYNLPALNHSGSWTYNSSSLPITNWNITYKQTFNCNLWIISQSWSEIYNTPTCNSGYSPSWANCTDQTPPTITSVTSSSPACNTIRYTINGATDTVWLHATPYSFDGWSTWQAWNTKDVSGTSYTISTNLIKVKDSTWNIYSYASSVNGTSSSCAVNCSYTVYTPWTCSVSCWGWTYTYYYTITVPASNGWTCPVSQWQYAYTSGSCNTQACCVASYRSACPAGCNTTQYLYNTCGQIIASSTCNPAWTIMWGWSCTLYWGAIGTAIGCGPGTYNGIYYWSTWTTTSCTYGGLIMTSPTSFVCKC